jgi:hypothetical protein
MGSLFIDLLVGAVNAIGTGVTGATLGPAPAAAVSFGLSAAGSRFSSHMTEGRIATAVETAIKGK